nr:hypothetical protein [Tanacetum cinerariifolium]
LKETLSKLIRKAVVNEAVTLHPIDPELLKIDVAPLASKFCNNRTTHNDYLKHTQEETATLREIVENKRLLNPLNTSLDYACKTMDTTIDQQVARDEALVPHAKRLRNGRSNFRLLSDIKSKESTLQLVYDVLRLTPFFKAFLVTTVFLEIYMQEFWATTTVHHYSIRALLPIELTNEDIRNSHAYKEYYEVATGFTPPKPKASVRKTRSSFDTTITPPIAAAGPRLTTSEKGKHAAKASKAKGAATPKTKASVRKMQSSSDTTMPHPTAAGTRLSTLAKGKQPAKSSKEKGLYVLYEVALTEAEQMKLAIKRSLQQTHISQDSGSSVDEGTGIILGVPDVPTYESDEKISWK